MRRLIYKKRYTIDLFLLLINIVTAVLLVYLFNKYILDVMCKMADCKVITNSYSTRLYSYNIGLLFFIPIISIIIERIFFKSRQYFLALFLFIMYAIGIIVSVIYIRNVLVPYNGALFNEEQLKITEHSLLSILLGVVSYLILFQDRLKPKYLTLGTHLSKYFRVFLYIITFYFFGACLKSGFGSSIVNLEMLFYHTISFLTLSLCTINSIYNEKEDIRIAVSFFFAFTILIIWFTKFATVTINNLFLIHTIYICILAIMSVFILRTRKLKFKAIFLVMEITAVIVILIALIKSQGNDSLVRDHNIYFDSKNVSTTNQDSINVHSKINRHKTIDFADMDFKDAKKHVLDLFTKSRILRSKIEASEKGDTSDNTETLKKELEFIYSEIKKLKNFLKENDPNLVFVPGEKPQKLSDIK